MWKFLCLLVLAAVIGCVCSTNICRLTEPCSVAYKTIGCFKDNVGDRVLPTYLYNERDATTSNYGNRNIEWYNWNNYVAEFSCRCAARAKAAGYDLFGVQFYGECWVGNKGTHNHARLGASDKCVGDSYKKCTSTDRYCAGGQETNFVYEIVDNTCNLQFERVGCYVDSHVEGSRPLANYVLNDRDPSASGSYSGQSIDWVNYDVYLPKFACRCAQKAQENNSVYFGLQFYGECWTHPDGASTFARDGQGTGCINGCYKDCGGYKSEICIGPNYRNYVYRLKTASQPACDVQLESIGCYTENPSDRALSTVLKNTLPGSEAFCGSMPVGGKWNEFFPEFLCTCARAARGRGWTHFGVTDYGACYSGENSASKYDKHGSSSLCREGSANETCAAGSMMCSGSNKESSYVYKVVSSGASKRSFQQPPPYEKKRNYDFLF